MPRSVLSTDIARMTFRIVDEHFKEGTLLGKLFNKKTIKMAYSTTWNMEQHINPKRSELLRGVLFGEMKFVLSNVFSSKDLNISYKSWDVQLTFDTLINAFRFKAKPLGGAKVKSAFDTKLSKFRKTSAISSIFIITFWIFFGERFDKLPSFSFDH